MHYVPSEVQEIDKRLGDDTLPDPASKLWDALRKSPGAHTIPQITDIFIVATERKKKTKKVEDLVKTTVAELKKAGFLYEFSGNYYLVLNKV